MRHRFSELKRRDMYCGGICLVLLACMVYIYGQTGKKDKGQYKGNPLVEVYKVERRI